MSAFLTILSAIGTVFEVIGTLSSAGSEASVLRTNAALAARTGADARARAAAQAETTRREALRRQGARVSAIGSTGLDLSGTALDVLADAALEEELAIQNILFEGESRAAVSSIEGKIFKKQAKAVEKAALFTAGTTLLTGGAQLLAQNKKKKE